MKKQTIEIGLCHSWAQILVFGVHTGPAVFLLLLVLSEITGWVLLALWATLNFAILPLIINLLDKFLPGKSKLQTLSVLTKIILTGVVGGLLAVCLYVAYYRFHFYYIGQPFSISSHAKDFGSIVTYAGVTITVAEALRRGWMFYLRKKEL